MDDWPQVAIGAVAEIFDGPHATPKTVDAGPIFLGISALQNGRINLGETRHVTQEDFRKWTLRVKPQVGDVVFSYETRLGEAAMIPDGLECCLGRRMGLVRANGSRLDPRFFLYVYLSPSFQDFIRSRTIPGATVDRIALKEFPSFPIPVPALHEQRAIASILGALDDKLDLNRRMNETLEAIARAIFKDWFVDFGPTRAKMEGRAPYLAPDIWTLFPDRLDEEGEPEGWKKEPLLEHARLISGGTPKTAEPAYWDGAIAWASAKDVSQCGETFLISTERTITERGLNESATRIVPRLSTVVVARGATTGRYCMFGRDMAMNQTCYALASPSERAHWLYCAFGSLVEGLVHAAHGSVFDTITTKTIEGARPVIAAQELLDRFETTVTPLFIRILANIENS